MLLTLFIVYILYILNPDPAGALTMSLIIIGSLGFVSILAIALFGIVANDTYFDTYKTTRQHDDVKSVAEFQ